MQIIIRIIINVDGIRQERLTEGSILDLNKRLKQNSQNKKFTTHVKDSMAFKARKSEQCNIPRSKVIRGKPPYGMKNWVLLKS